MAINSLGSFTNTTAAGTTGQRPITALQGTEYWNTDAGTLQIYVNGVWVDTTVAAVSEIAMQALIGVI